MGIYLRAQEGAYAESVLVAGDPGRITRLANQLEDCKLITDHRGLVGYTGTYKGGKISVQSSGMGCPSMAMVGEELISYGVSKIVRIGTCSSFSKGVGNGDLIIVSASAAGDGTSRALSGNNPYVAVPDFYLTSELVRFAQERGLRFHVGPVVTVDVEPHLNAATTQGWREQGLLAVEMESAALFHLSLKASYRNDRHVAAACVLTVSDGLDGNVSGAQSYMSDDALELATDAMHLVALDALTADAEL